MLWKTNNILYFLFIRYLRFILILEILKQKLVVVSNEFPSLKYQ